MAVIRRYVLWLVAGWLACQVGSLVAAPVLAAAGRTEDACCQSLAPGQTCPMHHHSSNADRTCKMRSGCPRGEAALVCFAGGLGVLPGATDVVIAFALGDVVSPLVPSALARGERPHSPPPRA